MNSELESYFNEMIKKMDVLDFLSRYLFPGLAGDFSKIRKAILLALVSHRDTSKRMRIHVLLVGSPGTGKTEILLFLKNRMGAFFVNAEYASKVGLTGSTSSNSIEPGILAEADGHIVAIDELDKMSFRDQSGLLQAMEEGGYIIVKSKFRKYFNAEVRVIASANDINKIDSALLDRFDFVFNINLPSAEERINNVDKIVDSFFFEDDTYKERIVLKYLEYIQDFEPRVSEEEIAKIKAIIKKYIELKKEEVVKKSYRTVELSILRIAYAIAKLYRRDLTALDVIKAIELKDNLKEDEIKMLQQTLNGGNAL